MNNFENSTVFKLRDVLTVKNYSPRTIDVYCHYACKFNAHFNKNLYNISIKEVGGFFRRVNWKSTSEQNQYINAVKLLFKYVIKREIPQIILERPRKEKHLPRVIDHDHLISSINKIENIKHKAILSLAYSVGLRVSEVINLKIEDVDSARMVINIRNAKGAKDRVVPLSQNMLDLLRNHLRASGWNKQSNQKYVFVGQNSEQYSPTSCNQLMKKYVGKDSHFHLLGHSSFTHLLESGVDLRIIQKLAGHNSSKTTECYTHVSTNLLHKVPLPI